MRILKIATIVALACGFLASQASATSLVRLDYAGGSTAAAGTGGSSILANPSDNLSFNVSVDVDSAGLAVLAFDISWSDRADMDVVATSWATGTKFTSFSPVTSILLGIPSPVATYSTPTDGLISNLGWTTGSPTGPFATSTNVFLGTIVFHVATANPSTQVSGLFNSLTAVGQDGALNLITPDFYPAFSVNVPEPGLSALMGLSLLGLALAGRKSKK
jgi:hypothetical protein